MTELRNYPDSKCAYGYKTLCEACAGSNTDRHVDKTKPIKEYLPVDRCEDCRRKGRLCRTKLFSPVESVEN